MLSNCNCKETKSAELIQAMKTDYFEINSSVRQENVLSALWFDILLQAAISKTNTKGNLIIKNRKYSAFTEDIAVIDRN